MNFFKTFRGKLLIILAFLLVATLGVQYYLNLETQEENNKTLEAQTQALVAGFALATNGLTSNEYMEDLVKREGQTFFDEKTTSRIKNILIIDNEWQVYDSLDPQFAPTTDAQGEPKYVNLSELVNLPPLMEGSRLGEDLQRFPNAAVTPEDFPDGEAHAIPVQTSKGRYYVMVILENDTKEAAARAARPLIYTLGILLLSTLTTFFLVWRFTRPIANLSNAARRIADGDLSVRVKGAERSDEMGELASRFNEMTAELAKNRELEARVQEAEKSAVVGRLASAIAHEIRNPLNYINLTLDHLRNKFKPEDPEKQPTFEKLTAQLKTEVGRINNQISDFLRYSRPIKLNLQPTDVREIIEDSLHIIEPQAEDQNIVISVVERENVSLISGDAEFLRSVFNNLFINAIQAMEKDGGNLNVTISPEDEFVKIEIADTGGGITEENSAKIFEPYFSTKETGTGLGLAIVKKVIDDHNGEIGVESHLNEGTKFTVRLPKVD
ncbi:MAG: Signal transduction histidine kinase [Acidobacteria bacterium]|jgi:signal transduction histidine kinase|nr:Signal transduction histidine kinase [Acidobacteriota bacterium]